MGILGDNVCKMVFLPHSECQYVSKTFKLTQGNILGHSLVINVAIICSLVCNVHCIVSYFNVTCELG